MVLYIEMLKEYLNSVSKYALCIFLLQICLCLKRGMCWGFFTCFSLFLSRFSSM